MVLAFSDFLDQDYFIPKKIFEDNGFVVDTLSTELGVAKSLTGVETKVNVLYSDIKTTDYKAVVFCGGPGMCKQDLNQNYLDLSKAFNSDNKIIGGICFGGKILATSGILKDKKASIPDKFSDFLKQEGITYVKNELVVDGNIVTAPEPPFNKEFAQAIVDLLNKQQEWLENRLLNFRSLFLNNRRYKLSILKRKEHGVAKDLFFIYVFMLQLNVLPSLRIAKIAVFVVFLLYD